jgi:hypothetical protein
LLKRSKHSAQRMGAPANNPKRSSKRMA